MKFVVYFLIVFSLISCNEKSKTDRPSISIVCRLERSYDSAYTFTNTSILPTFDVKLSIVNISDSVQSFWIMKCSWQDTFIISDDSFSFVGTECDGNFPTVRYLKSGDSLAFKTLLICHKISYVNTSDSIKIGFVMVDEKKYTSPDEYLEVMRDKSKQNNVVWSNSINLNLKR